MSTDIVTEELDSQALVPAGSLAAHGRAGPHVLLVDDNAEVRSMLGAALRAEGFSTAEAHGPKSAVALLADRSFDAAVVDLVMPRMHGLDVIAALRKGSRTRALPAVLLSALPLGEARELARLGCSEAGGIEFLDKPATPESVALRLRRLLAAR